MSDQRIKDLDKYCKIPASKRSVVITLLSAVGVTIQRRLRCRYAGLTRAIRTAKAPARIKQELLNATMAANTGRTVNPKAITASNYLDGASTVVFTRFSNSLALV